MPVWRNEIIVWLYTTRSRIYWARNRAIVNILNCLLQISGASVSFWQVEKKGVGITWNYICVNMSKASYLETGFVSMLVDHRGFSSLAMFTFFHELQTRLQWFFLLEVSPQIIPRQIRVGRKLCKDYEMFYLLIILKVRVQY